MARPETLAGEPEVVSEPGYRLLDLPLRVDHPFDVGHQQPIFAHENVIDVHLNVPEKKERRLIRSSTHIYSSMVELKTYFSNRVMENRKNISFPLAAKRPIDIYKNNPMTNN